MNEKSETKVNLQKVVWWRPNEWLSIRQRDHGSLNDWRRMQRSDRHQIGGVVSYSRVIIIGAIIWKTFPGHRYKRDSISNQRRISPVYMCCCSLSENEKDTRPENMYDRVPK